MNRINSLTLALLPLTAIAAGSLACATSKTPGQQTDDFVLEARVGHRLWLDPDVPRFKIDIDVDDGIVTLGGEVDDLSAAEEAQQLAQETKGVKGVVNLLEVEYCKKIDAASDIGIRTTVRSKLSEAAQVQSENIDVGVVDGVVYLSGVVDDREAKHAAQRIATEVEGVVRVENQIRVSPADTPTSEASSR